MNWKKIAVAGLLIIILVPVLVNIIMQIRLPWNIVFDGDWLGFFGAFFGASFTVIGAIYVSHLNTVKENKYNYYIELNEFMIIFNNYLDNAQVPDLNYKSLVSRPLSNVTLQHFLSKEKQNVDQMFNKIVRLIGYNANWRDQLFKLSLYNQHISCVINKIINEYLPQQPIKNKDDYVEYYILNYADGYDKLLNEAGIELAPYSNFIRDKFEESCYKLLDSEIKKLQNSFRVK